MYKYDKLWRTMKEKGISQYTLINEYEISESMLYRLRHNKSVSMHTIDRLCNILECDINDIVTYYRE
jgi:putative transcriptional regulator|nr:helix-turn-helix transcriptional regulator [uncultured Acetatifactor sp.]